MRKLAWMLYNDRMGVVDQYSEIAERLKALQEEKRVALQCRPVELELSLEARAELGRVSVQARHWLDPHYWP